MQEALDELWAYTGELFIGDAIDAELSSAGIAPQPETLKAEWDELVGEALTEATLKKPSDDFMHKGGKRGVHTEHMGFILADLQFLQRAYPGATW